MTFDILKRPSFSTFGVGYEGAQVDAYLDSLFKELDNAVKVYSVETISWSFDLNTVDTHQALLICIKKIKQDTAEDVLRDLVSGDFADLDALIKRSKKILGDK